MLNVYVYLLGTMGGRVGADVVLAALFSLFPNKLRKGVPVIAFFFSSTAIGASFPGTEGIGSVTISLCFSVLFFLVGSFGPSSLSLFSLFFFFFLLAFSVVIAAVATASVVAEGWVMVSRGTGLVEGVVGVVVVARGKGKGPGNGANNISSSLLGRVELPAGWLISTSFPCRDPCLDACRDPCRLPGRLNIFPGLLMSLPNNPRPGPPSEFNRIGEPIIAFLCEKWRIRGREGSGEEEEW